ncbi:MAG: amidohydrolase family protein [Actinobacteria bacterium]|nr:amidohydrolase family protein [Actinomycetota bacterium]
MLLLAKWVLPISDDPIVDGAVMVENDKIKEVGKAKDLKRKYSEEEIINFNQAVLMPGLIDVHTHLEYTIFRGICDDLPFSPWLIQLTKKSRKLNLEDWSISAKLGALEAIHSGITCVADMGKTDTGVKAILESGLRGVAFLEITGMDDSGLNERLKDVKKTISGWRKKVNKSSLLKIGVSPQSAYTVSPKLFYELSLLARKEDLYYSFHLAESPDEYDFIKYGSSMLANEFRDEMGWGKILWQPMGTSPTKYLEQWDVFEGKAIAAQCVAVSQADIDILKKYNAAIAHCPKSNAKLGTGVAPLVEFLRQGLRVGFGTGSLASNNTMDLFDEMRTALLIQRGVNKSVDDLYASKFVKIATLGGAEVLGLDNITGSLEAGKQADIIVVNISHSHQKPVRDPYSTIVYTSNQEDVLFTMVNGRILYYKDEWKTLDKEEIVSQSEIARSKLKN